MTTICSLSDFRKDTAKMIQHVTETSTPLYLTVNGRSAAVVVSSENWEKTQQSLAMLRLLSIREKQMDDGEVVSLDKALETIDAIIDAHGK